MSQGSPLVVRDQVNQDLVYMPMDAATAREIADDWKYPPPYDFYDMTADPGDYREFVTPELWPEFFLQVRDAPRPYRRRFGAELHEVQFGEDSPGIPRRGDSPVGRVI